MVRAYSRTLLRGGLGTWLGPTLGRCSEGVSVRGLMIPRLQLTECIKEINRSNEGS